MAKKAKKRKVKTPSKFGRYFAQLIARPGEEPVFKEEMSIKESKVVKENLPKISVKELKSAAENIKTAATKSIEKPSSSKEAECQEIDEEYHEEYSKTLKTVQEHTARWKKTGDTGLYVEPHVTFKEKVVSTYKKKRSETDKKRWVKLDQIKNRSKKSLFKLPKLLKPKKKQWTKPSPKKVAEVYEEVLDHAKSVEKQKKSQTRDDIDNIYKQLNSK